MAGKNFTFDKTELKTFPEKDQFRSPLREKLLEEEHCLIDNLWNLSTTSQGNAKKVACINALISHLISGKHFQKRPFICYVLYTGPKAGVYLTWEEMALLIEEIKLFPRYGQPLYKGYYDISEAINSVTKTCGEDIIISPNVLKYQNYLKHLAAFDDQDFLQNIQNKKPSKDIHTPKEISLRPSTSGSKTSFIDSLVKPPPAKTPEMTILGKTKITSIPKPPELTTEGSSLKTFVLLQTFLSQIAHNNISPLGITTDWELTFNPYKDCLSLFDNCPFGQDTECYCKLDTAIRKARIELPTFKPCKFQDYPITIRTLLKFGLIRSINTPPLHEFSAFLPHFLAETIETLILDFPRPIQLLFTSLYPDFQKDSPTFHLIEVLIKGIDDDFAPYSPTLAEPRTLKIEEPIEQQLDIVRAKIIAEDFGWTKQHFATKNLLREDNQGKLYCDTAIASRFFFPFDVTHPKPRLVESYRKRKENLWRNSSRPSSLGSDSPKAM